MRVRLTRLSFGLSLTLASAVLVGCTSGPPPYEESLPERAAFDDGAVIRVQAPTAAPTPEAFAFTARQLGGGFMVQGEELFARSPLLMFFATPTCSRCARDALHLARAAATHPDVVFVGVYTNGTDADVQEFVVAAGLSVRRGNVVHLVDDEQLLWGRFNADSQPTYVLVDGDGLARVARGELGQQGVAEAVELVAGGMAPAG